MDKSQKISNSLKIKKGSLFINDKEIENFFKITDPPINFDESMEKVREFINIHQNKKIAFVTVNETKKNKKKKKKKNFFGFLLNFGLFSFTKK